ncbi:MAG: hypothetical protein ABIR53_01715 [Paraperlucidibaca sp.]
MALFAPRIRDALLFHLVFFAIAIPLALKPALVKLNLGDLLMYLVAGYVVMLPLFGLLRKHREWVALWWFLLPLSMALPCADWMLVQKMGTLHFPDHGAPRLGGAVPIYFLGMWLMLLWPLCWINAYARFPLFNAAIMALIAFTAWEWAARPMGLWHADGVRQFHGFALYPLIPEMLLGAGALWMWQIQRNRPWLSQLFGALSVAVFYAGALSLSLLWIG